MHNDTNINRYIEKTKRGTSTHIQSQADKCRHKKSRDPQTQTCIAIDRHIKTQRKLLIKLRKYLH